MKREHLEHVLRAAAEICEENEFCIIGSQAILGEHPDINEEAVVRSIECDLYPERAPEKSSMLNSIGELSPFHSAFGYYADGVDETTAVLPNGWKERRFVIETRTLRDARVLGWCLETHDLLIAKYVAGRQKDFDYCSAVVRVGLVSQETLRERLAETPLRAPVRKRVAGLIDFHFAQAVE